WKGYHCNHSAASANYFRTTGSLLNKSDHQSKDRSTCVDRVLTAQIQGTQMVRNQNDLAHLDWFPLKMVMLMIHITLES
ncbi:hypothetical protein ACO0KY_19335, partial [Undibacterium sp. Dicai25W]|uniref:hypothetical protein n=1 Tax=Undibacterium sp. Dicai25W TaxID=3413034 RepID=UPI003BEF7033